MVENIQKFDASRGRYLMSLAVLYVFALCLGARLAYLFLADATRFPINDIKVVSSFEHISHQQFESILDKYAADSFFSFPVRKLNEDLTAIPWVKSVAIERHWPDALKVTVTDKEPAAIWNGDFLTADGDLFEADDSFLASSLLHLYGPINQQREVLQVYEKLSTILVGYNLHAKKLVLRDNQAWELFLTNGVLLRLGKNDLEQRVLRFCKAYAAVFADKPLEKVVVDLRYPRGMAIKWNQVAE